MDRIFTSALRLSEQGVSLKQIGKRLGISEQKVRKILITEGAWSSDTSVKIAALLKEGRTVDEIQAITGLSRNAVISYMPYDRGMQNAEYPTINALRIRKCRKNKEEDKDA